MNQSERAAMQAALDALRMPCDRWNKVQYLKVNSTIKLLEDALAQPEQAEPVAWFRRDQLQHIGGGGLVSAYPNTDNRTDLVPLYATPQQPASAKLTDEEILDCISCKPVERPHYLHFARMIETKIRGAK